MTNELISTDLLANYKKIQDLKKLLDNLENREWMRLMQAPHYFQKQFDELLKETNPKQKSELLDNLIKESEALFKIAAYHRFRNGSSIQIWATLKEIHASLAQFKSENNKK